MTQDPGFPWTSEGGPPEVKGKRRSHLRLTHAAALPMGLRCAGAPVPWALHSGSPFSGNLQGSKRRGLLGSCNPLARPILEHQGGFKRGHQSRLGADSFRPQSSMTPIVLRCFSSVCLSTCLVSTSDGFMEPGTLTRLNSLSLSFSCTHRSAVARWRILPSPRRLQIPIAAVASARISRANSIPKS